MRKNLIKAQLILVYAVLTASVALFVLYLGFMTQYYVLFYDGTIETFEYYKQLQVFNKEAFSLAFTFVIFAGALLLFELHRIRPGLFGLALVLSTTIYISLNSLAIIGVLPSYRRNYLALDFEPIENYNPSTFVFDAGYLLHIVLIGLLATLVLVSIVTFVQRLREGNPLIRRLA